MKLQHFDAETGPLTRVSGLTGEGTGPERVVDVEFAGYGPVVHLPLGQTEDPHGTAQMALDYFNGGFQALAYESASDEQAVSVRYNADGSIAEIAVRRDLMSKVITNDQPSPWQNARDKGKVS